MHELSLMQSTLDIVFAEAQRLSARRIHGLRMRIGALSGVVPESLEFAFEALTEGTLAQGARLEIERVPARCFCARCAREFEPPPHSFACPVCGRASAELRRGREMEVLSIEVEPDENESAPGG